MILSGEFSPGEKLLQEKIASQLGISRTPLHKAFVLLEEEFLVVSIPRIYNKRKWKYDTQKIVPSRSIS
jgi:DNA-binding GntR family transcriptional regulator